MFNGDPESLNPSESSEMGEAADGTGTTQPTQQPAQDMSQVMQMMGQLITSQQHTAESDVEVDDGQRSEFKFTKYHGPVFTSTQR